MRAQTWSGVDLAPPVWAKDFGGREHILPMPAKIDPSQFNRADSVLVTANGNLAGGTDEVQKIAITGTPGGGTFIVNYSGQSTAALAYNVSPADMQTALEGLSNIGAGNVEVYGTAGTEYYIVFRGELGRQNVAAVTTTNSFTGGSSPNTTITTPVAGVAAPTAFPVDALSGPIPSGTVLLFSGGSYATLGAAAVEGATSLTISGLSGPILDNETARYAGDVTIPKAIPSGTFIGRTYAERASETPFGPAATTDDEVYLTYFEVPDTSLNDDVELYRPGSLVAEDRLPGWTDATIWTSGLKTKLRAAYQTTLGSDGVD
jgi:hypothetical protein